MGSNGLFEVCAAADGEVIGIVKGKNRSLVLKHRTGGAEFLTIYQHLDLSECPLNQNAPVRRGQFLAKIWDGAGDPNHTPHLHFMVAVQGRGFKHSSGKDIPPLWYAIDSFGVYDYYQNRTDPSLYNYLRDDRPACFSYRIQGACHPIQWADQPLIKTLPIFQETTYLPIIRMQIRTRQDDPRAGLPPRELNQTLIWLEGRDDFFFIPFSNATGDNSVELKMADFLMQCFDAKRKVKIQYYPVGANNFISAVWAND